MIKLLHLVPVAAALLSTASASPVIPVEPSPRPFPSYVLDFAPLSHLWSDESWFPSDVAEHLTHVVPQVNFTNISESVTFLNIGGLSRDVFLSSKDRVEDEPAWMLSTENEPSARGMSPAPATIVCVEKEDGILDAFYFMFYSFNKGNTVLGLPMGNHIGDWEYIMVRFIDSQPSFIYLSAHRGGFAYNYSALALTRERATTFIAGGTHANYATPGSHFIGPLGILVDRTDAGPLWDVTLNFRGYWYHNATRTFSLAEGRGLGGREQRDEGTGWLKFRGRWGDQEYHVPQHGQYCIGENCRYSDGPTGPVRKNLGRKTICEYERNCTVLSTLPLSIPDHTDPNLLWNSGNTPLHLVFLANGLFVNTPDLVVFVLIGLFAIAALAILVRRRIYRRRKHSPIQLPDTSDEDEVESGVQV